MKTLSYNGNTYHINNIPVKESKTKSGTKIKKTEFMLANEKTFIFYKRNVHDFEIVSELRHWYTDLKQPSESQVRRAMLLIIDEDYALKSGGESNSDHIYSSSLKWMQAHPITGLDIEPVILQKFSKNFEDVLITFEEIEYLILNSLTENEKIQKVKNDIEGSISLLVDSIRRGKYKLRSGNTVTEVPYTTDLKTKVLNNVVKLDKNNYAPEYIDSRIDFLTKQVEPFINGTNWIIKNSSDFSENNKDEVKTQNEINFYTKIIEIYKTLKEELVPQSV